MPKSNNIKASLLLMIANLFMIIIFSIQPYMEFFSNFILIANSISFGMQLKDILNG